jgi:hypothetical protein
MAVRGTVDNRLAADGLGRDPGRPGQKKNDGEDKNDQADLHGGHSLQILFFLDTLSFEIVK